MKMKKMVVALGSMAMGLSAMGAVPAEDITLVPVVSDNLPLFYSLTGYANKEVRLDPLIHQMPLFTPYDHLEADWWDNVVAEQLQGRMPAIMMSTRGVVDPNNPNDFPGSLNPRELVWLIDAFNRAGVTPQLMKVTCFVDSPIFQDHYTDVAGLTNTAKVNFADTNNVSYTYFERGIKPWFDTVPRQWWATFDMGGVQRPMIQWWSFHPSWATNMQGNVSKLLTSIANKFESTYGVRPCFNMPEKLFTSGNQDSSVSNHPDIYGFNNWFIPSTDESYTITTHSNRIVGHMVPAYAHGEYYDNSPSNSHYLNPDDYISRQGSTGTGTNGDTMVEGLSAAMGNGVNVMSVEGWPDDVEFAGIYRSLDTEWDNPNQYINLMRKYTDLRTETLRLEFEGCDAYSDTTTGNSGGKFRREGDLDIQKLAGTNGGWNVGWIAATEYMEFRDVNLAPGTYKLSIRYAANSTKQVVLAVDGATLSTNTLPSTGSTTNFDTFGLGTITVLEGDHSFRVTSLSSGGFSLDWLFVKRVMTTVALKSTLNTKFVTAVGGGADLIRADSTAANNYQTFILCDRNGGTLDHGDSINIQTHNGLYLSAKNGGNSDLDADRLAPGGWERFTIEKASGTGTITSGTDIVLKIVRSGTNYYFNTTTNGLVNVKGTSIATATKFTLTTNVLVPKTVTFTSVAAEDGYIVESTETSNVGGAITATTNNNFALRAGDTSTKQQIKSIVSFDTSTIPPGAVIQSATLKLKRGGLTGVVTNLGSIRVDIIGGSGFGGATAMATGDFQAAATANNVATMSYPAANNDWSTGTLNSSGVAMINKSGKTQLKFYYTTDDDNDATADYLGFYSAEHATTTNRPVLEVTYR